MAHPVELWMLRCTHKIRPAGSSTKWSCGQTSASREFREAAIFEFKPDPWAPSVTRVIDEHSKGFGPLDSSFAPGSQEV